MCRKQVFDIGEHGAGKGLFEDADAVPAPQTGAKREEVPFAAGGEHFAGVDAELLKQHGEFVDQGDVSRRAGCFR